MKILNIVGARPNYMKIAPLHRAFPQTGTITSKIVHTGQHYDAAMNELFFEQLSLPKPDYYLGVGSNSHSQQTAAIMTAFEPILLDEKPDLVLVVGDVNSTLACSLVAVKEHVQVAHVEAGLRSFDRTMPEEINRIVTDSIADYLFVTEEAGVKNLRSEGVADEKVHMVGNTMIDSLIFYLEKAEARPTLGDIGVKAGEFALMTMHRPSNVDDEDGLRKILSIIEQTAAKIPLVFPVHPRTKASLEKKRTLFTPRIYSGTKAYTTAWLSRFSRTSRENQIGNHRFWRHPRRNNLSWRTLSNI